LPGFGNNSEYGCPLRIISFYGHGGTDMKPHFKTLLPVVSCVLLLLFTGCGSPETAAIGGAIVGGAAVNTFAGMQADLETARQNKLVELQVAVDELDAATTETEKAVLQAKVKALESTIQNLQEAQAGVQLAREATEVDWTDPAAVGGYGGTVFAAVLAWYLRRKGLKSEAKYQAHKQGTEGFMRANPTIAAELYNSIGKARAGKSL